MSNLHQADIRKFLPRNYAKTVAQKLGCGVKTVYEVAAGRKENRIVKGELCLLAEMHITVLTQAVLAENRFKKLEQVYYEQTTS